MERSFEAFEPVESAEATAFAARFAADYLSWDEDDPDRRARVLSQYLPDSATVAVGWSGRGRQRADFALQGRTLRINDDVIVVEVTTRITTYRRVGRSQPATSVHDTGQATEPPGGSVGRSSAPPSHAPSWEPTAAHWVRLAVPVTRDDSGALIVDIGPLRRDPDPVPDNC